MYKQFEVISRGRYSYKEDKVYSVESEDGIKQHMVYDGYGTLYCFLCPEGQIYKKTNGLPLYVNLSTENGSEVLPYAPLYNRQT